jgi:DNA-binding MarR family transcriptional regulator
LEVPVTAVTNLADIEVYPPAPRAAEPEPHPTEVVEVALPPVPDGPMVVVEALNRAASAVRHHVEQGVLRPADLSWTGYSVLVLTCDERSVETRAAAAAIGISRGTLTGVVHTLENKGLVRRMPHCRDGRLVLLEPTAAGRRLARRLAPRVRAAEDYAIGCLDPRERVALAGLLGRVVAELNPDAAEGHDRDAAEVGAGR